MHSLEQSVMSSLAYTEWLTHVDDVTTGYLRAMMSECVITELEQTDAKLDVLKFMRANYQRVLSFVGGRKPEVWTMQRVGELFWYQRQGHGISFTDDIPMASSASDSYRTATALATASKQFGEVYLENQC